MKTISLKVPENLDSRLEALAARRATSKSEVVREAVEAYLSASCAVDTLGHLAGDLAGCAAGPPDLSTSQEHLGDFGT